MILVWVYFCVHIQLHTEPNCIRLTSIESQLICLRFTPSMCNFSVFRLSSCWLHSLSFFCRSAGCVCIFLFTSRSQHFPYFGCSYHLNPSSLCPAASLMHSARAGRARTIVFTYKPRPECVIFCFAFGGLVLLPFSSSSLYVIGDERLLTASSIW